MELRSPSWDFNVQPSGSNIEVRCPPPPPSPATYYLFFSFFVFSFSFLCFFFPQQTSKQLRCSNLEREVGTLKSGFKVQCSPPPPRQPPTVFFHFFRFFFSFSFFCFFFHAKLRSQTSNCHRSSTRQSHSARSRDQCPRQCRRGSLEVVAGSFTEGQTVHVPPIGAIGCVHLLECARKRLARANAKLLKLQTERGGSRSEPPISPTRTEGFRE